MKLSKVISFACISAVMLLQACATGPAGGGAFVQISDPEQMFSAADWTPDVDAAVKAAGWSARAEEIKAHMNEKGGWPAKLADGDARWMQSDVVKLYQTDQIASLSFYDQPAVLLHIPASANQHMPDGWKPTTDFFIIIGAGGVPAN